MYAFCDSNSLGSFFVQEGWYGSDACNIDVSGCAEIFPWFFRFYFTHPNNLVSLWQAPHRQIRYMMVGGVRSADKKLSPVLHLPYLPTRTLTFIISDSYDVSFFIFPYII